MGNSYKLPKVIVRRNRLESQKKYREANKEKAKKYRESNKERIKKIQREYYLNNYEKCRANSEKAFHRRMDRYHEDEMANLKENVNVSKFRAEKAKKNKKWKEKIINQSKQRLEEHQEQTIENGAMYKNSRWSEGEIEYLRKNHKKMTTLEMALELDRTFKAIKAALCRFKIGRKVRILKGIYY